MLRPVAEAESDHEDLALSPVAHVSGFFRTHESAQHPSVTITLCRNPAYCNATKVQQHNTDTKTAAQTHTPGREEGGEGRTHQPTTKEPATTAAVDSY